MRSLALIVGINDYTDPSIPNLRFCVSDAEDLGALLSEPEYGYDVTLLLDGDATQRAIRLAAHRLRSTSPDRFLFFFAGHGAMIGDRGYLVAADGVDGDYGIEMSSLAEIMSLGDAGIGVALLDCCHAGTAVPWRGVAPVDSLTTAQLFRDARGARGQALIGACRQAERAKEDPALGHGKFTNVVLNGLMEGAVAPSGEVTLLALYDYVCRAFDSDPAQQPVLRIQVDERIVLGQGLTPGQHIDDSGEAVRQAVASAQGRVDALVRLFSVDRDAWRDGGWVEAARGLAPIVHEMA